MNVRSTGSGNKKPYRERRRGGRDRTAAFYNADKRTKQNVFDVDVDDKRSTDGFEVENKTDKAPEDRKITHSQILKLDKGADLQQEQGAELSAKNRLKEKQSGGINAENPPSYGNYNRNQRKYRRHAAKVKEYTQPYKSIYDDFDEAPEKPKADDNVSDEFDGSDSDETHYTPYSSAGPDRERNEKTLPGKPAAKINKLEHEESTSNLKPTSKGSKLQIEPERLLNTESSRWSKVKSDSKKSGNDGTVGNTIAETDITAKRAAKKGAILKTAPDGQQLKADKSKLGVSQHNKPDTGNKSKLAAAPAAFSAKLTDAPTVDNGYSSINLAADRTGSKSNPVTQKEFNRKKQYNREHGLKNGERHVTDKPPETVEKQRKPSDETNSFAEKSSDNSGKLQEKQAETIVSIPLETTKHNEYSNDVKTGGNEKNVITGTRTSLQNETRWNNPKFIRKLRNAKGTKGKTAVISKVAAKKDVILNAAGTVGTASAVTAAALTKPPLKYSSKLITDSAHRQVREDIRQSNNEVLQAAHWAEQKGERAIAQGFRKLNPAAVRRYIKNTPYRRESKLKIKQLKNDKRLVLLRVKGDKESGINHMTGKKSTAISRAWQKRQINRNYQKAISAAKGKSGGGTFGDMARELSRGNPKGVLLILAKKAAIAATQFAAKITVFNPFFWKLMLIALMLIIILASVQACAIIFSPGLAGVGFVDDEDISYSTRLYSGWEVDMRLYLDSANIALEFPPPANITAQPGVIGEVVYPLPPYTPPPPFYEYRFEIGMIRHDPMELISYLTARHGGRFDEDSDNPMTRSDLEAILAEIFEAQYGIPPGNFSGLIHEEVETRFRRERRWEQTGTQPVIIGYDLDGSPIWGTEPVFGYVYHDIYYDFWILTVRLESRSLSEVLRSRMTIEEQAHFDVLVLTGNGRQIVGNPFNFNWLPNITSHYGYRINPTGSGKQLHLGIDIAAPLGTPVFATHTGTIVQVQFSDTGYGNMVRLSGEGMDGTEVITLFAHLHEIKVAEGQEVTQGDLIATVGSSGDSTGPHLHLEVIRQNPVMHLNPLFAVITWTDDEGNENFRPMPGESGTGQFRPPHIPDIPPEAMSDERFAAIFAEAVRHLGARYVWGGAGPTTFDCSGFIHWVFTNAGIGWTHGRTTSQGYFNMSTPVSAENARPGDLVFFTGTHSGAFITHVGIYIGGGQMIHTGGNPAGVEFVNLNTPFWQRHFYSFGRV